MVVSRNVYEYFMFWNTPSIVAGSPRMEFPSERFSSSPGAKGLHEVNRSSRRIVAASLMDLFTSTDQGEECRIQESEFCILYSGF